MTPARICPVTDGKRSRFAPSPNTIPNSRITASMSSGSVSTSAGMIGAQPATP